MALNRGVLDEPSLQQPPLPEQRLMRRLDRDLAGIRRDVGREQPLLDQKLDERAGLFGDLGEPRHPSTGAARLGIDSGEPGIQSRTV